MINTFYLVGCLNFVTVCGKHTLIILSSKQAFSTKRGRVLYFTLCGAVLRSLHYQNRKTLISSQVPFDMELCLRRRLSGGRWTAVDKSSPDWR